MAAESEVQKTLALASRLQSLVSRPEIHTMPVPAGWSAEQAWEAIARGDKVDDSGGWTNVVVVGDRLVQWLPVDAEDRP